MFKTDVFLFKSYPLYKSNCKLYSLKHLKAYEDQSLKLHFEFNDLTVSRMPQIRASEAEMQVCLHYKVPSKCSDILSNPSSESTLYLWQHMSLLMTIM